MGAARNAEPGFRITSAKGFHVTFKNGWTISVQFGPGNYCDNYDMDIMNFYGGPRPPELRSSTAEIAFWGPDYAMQEFPGEYSDTVKGRVTPEDVLALMNDISGR